MGRRRPSAGEARPDKPKSAASNLLQTIDAMSVTDRIPEAVQHPLCCRAIADRSARGLRGEIRGQDLQYGEARRC